MIRPDHERPADLEAPSSPLVLLHGGDQPAPRSKVDERCLPPALLANRVSLTHRVPYAGYLVRSVPADRCWPRHTVAAFGRSKSGCQISCWRPIIRRVQSQRRTTNPTRRSLGTVAWFLIASKLMHSFVCFPQPSTIILPRFTDSLLLVAVFTCRTRPQMQSCSHGRSGATTAPNG